MEFFTLLLAALLLWWFFFEVTSHRVTATRAGGRLLLRLSPTRVRFRQALCLGTGVVFIVLGTYFVTMNFGYDWGTALIYLVIGPLGFVSAYRARAAGVELREQGIARPVANRLVFSPWSDVLYCRWKQPPGTLLVQLRRQNEEFRVEPGQIAAASAVLRQYVDLRDAPPPLPGDEAGPSPDKPADEPADGSTSGSDVRLVGFQFTLRMLLVFVLSASAFSSWIGIKMQQARQQARAVAALEPFQPRPYYRGVYVVRLDFPAIAAKRPGDADLAHLADLERLEFLDLSSAPVTDRGLVYLERLTSLRFLNLSGTQVTRAGLRRLKAALPKAVICP